MSGPGARFSGSNTRPSCRAWLFVLLCVALVLAGGPSVAAAPPALPASTAGDWEIELVSATTEEVVLDIRIVDFARSEITAGGTLYQRVGLARTATTQEIGKPELPVIGRFVAIPPGASVSVEVIAAKPTLYPDYLVYPVQKPPTDQDESENPPFVIDTSFYARDTMYPAERAIVDAPQTMRDLTVVTLNVHPLQYNPARRELLLTSEMRVRLHFSGGGASLLRDGGARADDAFADLCAAFVVNCAAVEPLPARTAGEPDTTGAEYLIVSAPDYVTAANTLATWKNERGIRTVVRTTADTGTSAAALKSYIQTAYDTWNPKPAYLLLLGDVESIPVHYVTEHPAAGVDYPSGHKNGTDLYYATMGGSSDLLPDIHLGRISADSLAEADHIVAKIIAYETNPPADSGFYNRAMVAAYFQDGNNDGTEDRLFVRTSEDIRDYLLAQGYTVQRIYHTPSSVTPIRYNDGTALPGELLKPGFAWDGSSADIIAAFNEGAFLVTHRDHGSPSGWGDPSFYTSHIDSLSNGTETPVVFSINCESGYFDTETDGYSYGANPCFAEKLLRYGSGSEGGAAGVFAATRISYSWHNDRLMNGFVDGLWPDYLSYSGAGSQRMGDVLTHGKYYYYSQYSTSTYRTTTLEIFHYLGDPTMALWTAEPIALSVSHEATVDAWKAAVPVYVAQPGATIAISQDGAWFGTATSTGGWQHVSLRAILKVGIAHITVTGDNYTPYRGTIDVVYGEPSCVVQLPAVFKGVQWPALLRYDDFSNPTNGWHVGTYPACEFAYLDGQYRMLVKQEGTYMFPSIAPLATDFSLEADGRYASSATGAYGLLFGGNDAMTQWYVFRIGESDYNIIRFDNGVWTNLQPWTDSPYINTGSAWNHLRIVRDGARIDAYINGHLVKTVYDSTYTGMRRLGLFARGWAGGDVNVDTRFDNFRVMTLGTSGTSAVAVPAEAAPFRSAPFVIGDEGDGSPRTH